MNSSAWHIPAISSPSVTSARQRHCIFLWNIRHPQPGQRPGTNVDVKVAMEAGQKFVEKIFIGGLDGYTNFKLYFRC